jgi:hypothetical protein
MIDVERRGGGGLWRAIRWSAIAGLLALPAIAMQFTREVNWTAGDFLFAGVVLVGAGMLYELAAWKLTNRLHRTLAGLLILGFVVAVWGWAAAGP